jgi:hypothetical protein
MLFRWISLTAILCCGLAAGSLFYRTQKGKPILRPNFSELRFLETWCSGRSDRTTLGSWMGASRILWVAVTKDTLHVGPHAPFNLFFIAEAFGWDHRVPGRTIVDIRESGLDSNLRGVLFRYRHRTGDLELLELSVSDHPGLLKALHEISR